MNSGSHQSEGSFSCKAFRNSFSTPDFKYFSLTLAVAQSGIDSVWMILQGVRPFVYLLCLLLCCLSLLVAFSAMPTSISPFTSLYIAYASTIMYLIHEVYGNQSWQA